MSRKFVVYFVLLLFLFCLTALTSFARTPSNSRLHTAGNFDLRNPERVTDSSITQQNEISKIDQMRFMPPEEFKFDVDKLTHDNQLTTSGGGETCRQLLINTQLDVVEIGGGLGTAEPWVVVDDIVYYTTDVFWSPDYSLFLADGDIYFPPPDTDPSPGFDTFGQAFFMPDNLTSVTVDYYTLQFDQDIGFDLIFGEIWSVDEEGFLIEPLLFWEFVEYLDEQWHSGSAFTNDPAFLDLLENRLLALLLFNDTDEVEPFEIAVFDDITMTICYEPPAGGVYLPAMIYNMDAGPSCSPPSENPPDQFDSNRGHVETGATCNTTLSNFDLQDYYTFLTNQSDTYRFSLSDLPDGSEWSVTVFEDAAPYNIAAGGNCRTTQPGDGDKFVDCLLPANGDFFVKVSAGGWSGGVDSYTMQVTQP